MIIYWILLFAIVGGAMLLARHTTSPWWAPAIAGGMTALIMLLVCIAAGEGVTWPEKLGRTIIAGCIGGGAGLLIPLMFRPRWRPPR